MHSDWDDYRFFLALAETGSPARAAERLNVSQPTVARRIKELESRLGATLFDRSADGHVLTAVGERIRELVEGMERNAHAIERRVLGADSSHTGQVRITATEGLARSWLIPRLRELTADHPGLQIDLSVGISMSDLLRREADIALRIGDTGSDQLVGRRLGQVSCGLYASRAYLARRGEPQTLKELAQHDIIESTRDIESLLQARTLRRTARGAHVTFACDNVAAQVAAARAGFGLVPLLTYMRAEAPELQRVLRRKFDIRLDLWMLTHRDLRQTARIRVVLDHLADAFDRDDNVLTDGG